MVNARKLYKEGYSVVAEDPRAISIPQPGSSCAVIGKNPLEVSLRRKPAGDGGISVELAWTSAWRHVALARENRRKSVARSAR